VSFLYDAENQLCILHNSSFCSECPQLETELPENVRAALVTMRLLGINTIPTTAAGLKESMAHAGMDQEAFESVLRATFVWRKWYRFYIAKQAILSSQPPSMSEIAWRSILAELEPLQPQRLYPFWSLGSGDKKHYDCSVWDAAIQEAAQPVAPVIWTDWGAIVGEEKIKWDDIKKYTRYSVTVYPKIGG
jgi:hypothetical protein